MPEIQVSLPRLHPGQVLIHQSTARYRVVMCGRRFGKTTYGIAEACEAAIAGGTVGWYSPTYRYALDAWRDVVRRLRPIARDVSEQEKRLTLVTGGVVDVWTCDTPDPGRGRAYDLVVIDEAGIIRGLKDIWQQAIRPTLTDRAGRALFLGTPKGRTHDYSTLFAHAETATDWAAFRAGTVDNPYIPAEEVAAAQRDLPPQVFAQEYEGIPADDGGNPFGLDAIARCTMSNEEWVACQQRETVTWGWDFARAQDWTVGVALGTQYEVTGFARWQLKPWGETYRDVAKLTRTSSWGDSTGIGDVIVETLQRMSCPIQGYQFSQPSKQRLMERLASAIQQGVVRFPDGPIRSELETFGYTYTRGGVHYEAPTGLHDDCVVALALAVHGRDQMGAIPYEPPELVPASADHHPGFDTKARTRKLAPWERRYAEEIPAGWPGSHSGFHLPRQDELTPASED